MVASGTTTLGTMPDGDLTWSGTLTPSRGSTPPCDGTRTALLRSLFFTGIGVNS